MDYTVCKVTSTEDDKKVVDFILDNFVPNSPLLAMFGFENNPNAWGMLRKTPDDTMGITVKAIDDRGEIIGCVVNKALGKPRPKADLMDKREKQIADFFKFVEEEAELNKLPERTMCLKEISVRQDWTQRGVGKSMAIESMKQARAAGYTTMVVRCASEYAARLVRSLGWREHYRLAYRDYSKLSGTSFNLVPSHPHEHFYIYTLDLDDINYNLAKEEIGI